MESPGGLLKTDCPATVQSFSSGRFWGRNLGVVTRSQGTQMLLVRGPLVTTAALWNETDHILLSFLGLIWPVSHWTLLRSTRRKKTTHKWERTALVVQWWRICLPMPGTWVGSPDPEDFTCLGATKPVCHNYGAHALEHKSLNC